MSLKLSILDQSPISEGTIAEEALQQTVQLAQFAETKGFTRFWVSEHHDSITLAGSSPEVLMTHLAAKTKHIRIGSGGIMLPHYSAYKVAENFKVLEGLNPGRIDLGLGRAPGGMPRAAMALQDGKYPSKKEYSEQIKELLAYLHQSLEKDYPYYGLKATPLIQTVPEVWLLGSSPNSARLAAENGLPYVFAQFINGVGGLEFTEEYRQNFKPSSYLKKPKNMVAVFCICAETEEKAEYVATSLDLSLLMLEQGMNMNGTPSPQKAERYAYSPYEYARIRENRLRMVVGTPKSVKDQLYKLSEQYETDEIMLVTITYDFHDKLSSFDLIANEML